MSASVIGARLVVGPGPAGSPSAASSRRNLPCMITPPSDGGRHLRAVSRAGQPGAGSPPNPGARHAATSVTCVLAGSSRQETALDRSGETPHLRRMALLREGRDPDAVLERSVVLDAMGIAHEVQPTPDGRFALIVDDVDAP